MIGDDYMDSNGNNGNNEKTSPAYSWNISDLVFICMYVWHLYWHSIHFSNDRNAKMRQYDKCTHLQWNESIHKAWKGQLFVLVDQYLIWRYGTGVMMQNNEGAHHIFHGDSVGVFGTWSLRPGLHLANVTYLYFTEQLPVTQRKDELNAMLVHVGLLGCSPIQPIISIKLEYLELYH